MTPELVYLQLRVQYYLVAAQYCMSRDPDRYGDMMQLAWAYTDEIKRKTECLSDSSASVHFRGRTEAFGERTGEQDSD